MNTNDTTQEQTVAQDKPAVADFANKVEDLMYHADVQSQSDPEHKSHWDEWKRHLAELWKKVKQV